MMHYRKTRTAAGLTGVLTAGLLALAACSQSEPEQPLTENDAVEEIAPEETPSPVETPDAEPTGAAMENMAAIAPPPAAEIAPDMQVLDDADATGMTARVSRDEAPAADAPTTAAPANDGTAP